MPPIVLPESERPLFDSIAVEHLGLSVGEVELYAVDKSVEITDTLYQEPQDRWSYQVYRMTAWVKRPSIEVKPEDPGQVIEKAGVFVVARKHLEDNNIPVPKVGDVLKFWEQYYDITKVEPVGFKSDANFFTHWRGELVRRTRHLPDVKVETREG